jgi:hypothetical protein
MHSYKFLLEITYNITFQLKMQIFFKGINEGAAIHCAIHKINQ